MKHLPFDSIYRTNFEVVEQRDRKTTLFPHTEQLPVLLRALNLEFYDPLPARLSRADHRASGFHKLALKTAALFFSIAHNAARADHVRLIALPNPDLVTKIAIVQQITEERRRGLVHRFRFYAGPDFFPDIYLCGKLPIFTDHVLQRFSKRIPNHVGEDLSVFLVALYGSPIISMPVGAGRAFIIPFYDTILAFPYDESENEYVILTCLTVNEMHSLSLEVPPCACNFHYSLPFTRPKVRNWFPTRWAKKFHTTWERKVPVPPPKTYKETRWSQHAAWIFDIEKIQKQGEGSRLCFEDNIPGPKTLEVRPDQYEAKIDELAFYKKQWPEADWDSAFANLDHHPTGAFSEPNGKRIES